MSIDNELEVIKAFQGESLTQSLADIEKGLSGTGSDELGELYSARGLDESFMNSAVTVKRITSQIDVIIHAAGILRSLTGILQPNEVIESVSLGAGNTGRKFDLETTLRVAEYKFIDWRGGSEAIRQNGVFKDFFMLAEHETKKQKQLFVVGTRYPLKFLNGGRALTSVLSRNPKILNAIQTKYGKNITKVRDYYEIMKNEVAICDVTPYIGT